MAGPRRLRPVARRPPRPPRRRRARHQGRRRAPAHHQLKEQDDNPEVKPSTDTVGAWVPYYFEHLAGDLTPRTLHSYRYAWTRYGESTALASTPLTRLSPKVCQTFVNSLGKRVARRPSWRPPWPGEGSCVASDLASVVLEELHEPLGTDHKTIAELMGHQNVDLTLRQ